MRTLERIAAAGALAATLAVPAQATDNHLQWFGMAGGCDQPYEHETTPFSNTCVIPLTDTRLLDPAWTSAKMRDGTRLIVTLHDTLYQWAHDPTPQVPWPPFNIRPDAAARLQAAIAGKERALQALVQFFYLADEPNWTGISRGELAAGHNIVKARFPGIQTLTSINHVLDEAWFEGQQVPTDAIGYHQYEVRDPRIHTLYQQNVQTIKAHAQNKPFLYVLDAWWSQGRHGAQGLTQADMADVARNYHAMAMNDTDAVALIGFLWQTFPEGTGARDLPQDVQLAYREIGSAITGKCLAPDSVQRPEHALFLQGCRFYATTQYWVPWQGNRTGFGIAVPQSREFGQQWFFGETNIEMGIKLIDGHAVNDRWWVFASGYTSLPVEINLYDTQRDNMRVWRYTHPGGLVPPAMNGDFP